MNNFICPLTKKELSPLSVGNYIRYISKRHNISKEDFRYEMYKLKFGEYICSEEGIKEYYVTKNYSIPMFKREFNMNTSILFFLLKKYGIKKRTIQEANKLIGLPKSRKTIFDRYGVTNVSTLETIKEKKKQTFLKNYGVDNIRKHPPFYDYIKKKIEEKYGVSFWKYHSINSTEVWNKKTPAEREKWLSNSILSEKTVKNSPGGKSKLEYEVVNILYKLNIPHEHTFFVRVTSKKRYFYDIYLPDINLIIEINGDYWHANPIKYKEHDLMRYGAKEITAGEKWKQDKEKLDTARRLGYKTLTLWESDIREHMTNGTIDNYVTEKIKFYEN